MLSVFFILFSLSSGGFSGTNNTNGSHIMFGKTNNEQPSLTGIANNDLPILINGVPNIVENACEWIGKNSFRLIEFDTMILTV